MNLCYPSGEVPHHQTAVDIMEVALQFGKAPDVCALAETVILEQEAEIAQMTAWRAARPVAAAGEHITQ